MNNSILLPEKWKDLVLTETIGSGSNGTVYRAEDHSGQVYAIKIIPGEERLPSQELLIMLQECPFIIKIFDTAVENGFSYLKMEYLRSFADRMQEASFTEEEAIKAMLDLCRAVSYLSQHRILHRDIKPDNILIREDGSCVLCDVDQARLTLPDASLSVQGSVAYMAPETYWGRPCDSRSDLYAIGMVMYRCFNQGRPPFADEHKALLNHKDMENALEHRMKGEVLPKPSEASEALAEIILGLCAADPGDRYPDAEAIITDLLALQSGKYRVKQKRKRLKRRISIAAAIAAVALALVMGGLFAYLQNTAPLVEKTLFAEGSQIYYTIDHQGTAVFEGEGDVNAFMVSPDNSEWLQNRELVRKLVIKGGIRSFALPFTDCQNLRELVLEEGVERLEAHSGFANCRNLSEVTLSESLNYIAEMAFAGCISLKEIKLPANLEVVPANCLSNCNGLEKVILPENVAKIGFNAFFGTPWLESAAKETGYAVVNGILFHCSLADAQIEIPEELGIRRLGDGAFAGMESLKSIIISEGVVSIGESCFTNCKNLSRVLLPDSLMHVERYAFNNCSSLEQLDIPKSADVSAGDIFQECPFLQNITNEQGFAVVNHTLLAYTGSESQLEIPESLQITKIGAYAFWTNERLTRVVLPEGIREICDYAFFMCRNLEEVVLPDTIESIGLASFAGVPWQP